MANPVFMRPCLIDTHTVSAQKVVGRKTWVEEGQLPLWSGACCQWVTRVVKSRSASQQVAY